MTNTSTKRPKDKIEPIGIILARLPERLEDAKIELQDDQLRELTVAIRHIHADIRMAEQRQARAPSAQQIRSSYRSLDRAFAQFKTVLARHGDLGAHCLPDATLLMLGRSVSDSILMKVAQQMPDLAARRKKSTASDTDFVTENRDTIGLKNGQKLLRIFLDQLHGPIVEFCEADRKNKGGRPKDAYRELLIRRLVLNAEQILGVSPLQRTYTQFNCLCACVNDIFRLPEVNFHAFLRRTLETIRREQTKPIEGAVPSPVLTKGQRI